MESFKVLPLHKQSDTCVCSLLCALCLLLSPHSYCRWLASLIEGEKRSWVCKHPPASTEPLQHPDSCSASTGPHTETGYLTVPGWTTGDLEAVVVPRDHHCVDTRLHPSTTVPAMGKKSHCSVVGYTKGAHLDGKAMRQEFLVRTMHGSGTGYLITNNWNWVVAVFGRPLCNWTVQYREWTAHPNWGRA